MKPYRRGPARGALFESFGEFEHAYRDLKPGHQLAYHEGYLPWDKAAREQVRKEPGIKTPAGKETVTGAVARVAMALEQEGRAEIVQRRHGSFHYEYIIIKRHEVDEEGRCEWESFVSRARSHLTDRQIIPARERRLSTHNFELRESFLRRNPHLTAIDTAVRATPRDSRI